MLMEDWGRFAVLGPQEKTNEKERHLMKNNYSLKAHHRRGTSLMHRRVIRKNRSLMRAARLDYDDV